MPFGKNQRLIRDIPRRKQQVQLVIQRQRYRCKACGHAFVPHLQGVDDSRRTTKRLLRYIEYESRVEKRSNVDIATEVGLSESSIRNILHDYRQRQQE